jgi:UDP:flavonoid glycosyltransferase YjiC (YdhE family)
VFSCSNIRREKFPAAIEHHPRVLLLPFAPQRALLAHPYVSLFVSHGGAESSHEAMYDGVPMLIVSFFG